jgi:hypothetical protein
MNGGVDHAWCKICSTIQGCNIEDVTKINNLEKYQGKRTTLKDMPQIEMKENCVFISDVDI